MRDHDEPDDAPRREPIERSQEDVHAFMADLMVKQIDPALREFFGLPLIACLIVFPPNTNELASWIANADASERPNIAQALIELLTRWGYLKG